MTHDGNTAHRRATEGLFGRVFCEALFLQKISYIYFDM